MTDAGNISEQETSTRSSTPPSPTLPPHQERSEELRGKKVFFDVVRALRIS